VIAAIYARRSTDQSAVADEAKSVTRQIEHARQYAKRKGWTVDEACIFTDDGISGAEFATRPGFVRLMAALKPRPPFDVLIMSEESRLGREQIEVSFALKQLIQAGVRVFLYMADVERTLNTPIEKGMLAMQTMADEIEREKAKQRMFDTMHAKAQKGHSTGGKCYGYDNVRLAAGHVEQRINPEQAAVIVRIFELAAAGYGQRRIAIHLNDEGALAPSAQQGRPRAWCPASIHEVLHRPRYRGEIIYNKTAKRDRWGQRRRTARAASEWITISAPHLRIVSDELWSAAHAQIDRARQSTAVRSSRPEGSKYLLPGMARCAICNGGIYVRTRRRHEHSVERRGFYACTSHFDRGNAVCSNGLQFPMEEIDKAVLGKINNILTDDLGTVVTEELRRQLAPDGADTRYAKLTRQIEQFDQQMANLAEAIAMSGTVPALVARLKQAETERQRVVAERDEIEEAAPLVTINWTHVEREIRTKLANWRDLLGRNITEARQVLGQVLDGPLKLTPILEPERRGYRFEGAIHPGNAISGAISRGSSNGVPGRI
jgi:site-specific DNA recombinase